MGAPALWCYAQLFLLRGLWDRVELANECFCVLGHDFYEESSKLIAEHSFSCSFSAAFRSCSFFFFAVLAPLEVQSSPSRRLGYLFNLCRSRDSPRRRSFPDCLLANWCDRYPGKRPTERTNERAHDQWCPPPPRHPRLVALKWFIYPVSGPVIINLGHVKWGTHFKMALLFCWDGERSVK